MVEELELRNDEIGINCILFVMKLKRIKGFFLGIAIGIWDIDNGHESCIYIAPSRIAHGDIFGVMKLCPNTIDFRPDYLIEVGLIAILIALDWYCHE